MNTLAGVIDTIISPDQSTFVKDRLILDGSLMVNEIIDCYKRKKKRLMIFKVDFDNVYDSISSDYLMQTIHYIGFDGKWIRWIKACLLSSQALVLVNDNATTEFRLHRGLQTRRSFISLFFLNRYRGGYMLLWKMLWFMDCLRERRLALMV